MRLLLSLLLLSLGLSAKAQQVGIHQYFRNIDPNGKIISNGVFQEKVPSIQDIVSGLPNFKSDTDFLFYLLTSYPHLKNNFILVHKTESQQLSSLTHPRIIFYGGGSAFAFSEDPQQRDRRVEILTADSKSFAVSLHEITFKHGNAKLESNPTSCTACHGAPARALWNPYDFWPNAFGSSIGRIGTKQEALAYENLKSRAPKSELLSQLNLPVKYNLDTEGISAFSMYISGLNQGRWIAHNLKTKAFDKVAKPFIAVIGGCVNEQVYNGLPTIELMKKFLPTQVVDKNLFVLNEMVKDQISARNSFKTMLDKQLINIYPNPVITDVVDHSRLESEAPMMAYMRWVLSLGGVDSSDLSASLFGNDTLMASPGHFMAEFTTALYEIRPDLLQDFKFKVGNFVLNSSYIQPDCDSLMEAINKEAQPEFNDSHFVSLRRDAKARPVLSRCSKCHSEGLGDWDFEAPYIPFNDPGMMSQLLRAPNSNLRAKIEERVRAHGNDQMPPENRLSEAEIAALLAYLDNLK